MSPMFFPQPLLDFAGFFFAFICAYKRKGGEHVRGAWETMGQQTPGTKQWNLLSIDKKTTTQHCIHG